MNFKKILQNLFNIDTEKDRRGLTANDVLKNLEKDVVYQNRRKLRSKQINEMERNYKELSRPIIKDLKIIGTKIKRLEELSYSEKPTPANIVNVLLKWISISNDLTVLEFLVRPLMRTEEPYDGNVLIELFERPIHENLRWIIGDVIQASRPYGIDDWIIKAVKNPKYKKSKEMLLIALYKIARAQEAIPILISSFDQYPIHVTEALSEIGGKQEIAFLKSNRDNKKKPVKEKIDIAIEKIQQRIEKQITERP